jgi:hypothetical protein
MGGVIWVWFGWVGMDFISYWVGLDWVCLQSGLGGVGMSSLIRDGNPLVCLQGEQLDGVAVAHVVA